MILLLLALIGMNISPLYVMVKQLVKHIKENVSKNSYMIISAFQLRYISVMLLFEIEQKSVILYLVKTLYQKMAISV